ncbi:MAG: hypothetical protein Q7S45_00570 [Candidatus Curtissbacteria bacterium]|nr:hypothetical protein [Candidatus Curtissbacteria bacterium]
MQLVIDLEASRIRLWQIASNVSNYPRYFKYVHFVKAPGSFEVGSSWWDISTILYFPIKVKHKIVKIVPNKEVKQEINLPFGGEIIQNINITSVGDKTKVKIKVLICQNTFMDFFFGRVIEVRTQAILLGALERVQREIAEGTFEEARVDNEKGVLNKLVIPNSRYIVVPALMSFVILAVLAIVVGFNMPTEIRAVPGKVISKVESLEVGKKGVKTIESGIVKVKSTVQEIVF